MTERKERRKYPRIQDKDISVQLSGSGFTAITKSLDVSASGIYCKVKERIPLMTKLQIILSLPNKNKPEAPAVLNIEGVVVREHPVIKDGHVEHYDVAIFFHMLSEKEREKLIKYVNRQKTTEKPQ